MTLTYTKRIGSMLDGKGRRGGKKGVSTDDTANMPRADMTKSRQLVKTGAGRKAEIRLRRGTVLRHGDVLEGVDQAAKAEGRKSIVIKQVPEKAILAKFLAWDPTDNPDPYYNLGCDGPLQVGHMLGEMRKPISIRRNGEAVSFPIQRDSELGAFEKRLKKVSDDVEAEITREIFVEGLIDEGYYEH